MSVMPRATGSPQGPDGPSRGLRRGPAGAQHPQPHSPHGWGDEPRAFTPTFSRELWGRGGRGGTTTPVPAGASPQCCPSTGSGALPGRCCHCSSPQALQTAQGKIFNLSSYFNLKCEKKSKKNGRMSASPRRHSPTAAAAPRQGPGPAVGAPSSCTRGNLGAEISSWHRAARRMKKGTHPGPGKHKNMGRFEREHPHCGVSGLLPICPTGKSDCVTSSLLKTTEIKIFEKVPSLKPPWEQFLGQQQQQ